MTDLLYKKVHVNVSRSYDIVIGDNLLSSLGEYVGFLFGNCRLALLTDSNVNAIYGNEIVENLSKCGFDVFKYVIPAGEESKTAENMLAFLNFMAENRLTRSDALIAFGGGVVGDLGGLSASLYLRGIPYIQVPTTLLAAVDSSVGGKTAIDIPAGKNLVGAFYQPHLVCCDTKLMDTLHPDIYRDGCAEIIKYGVILDKSLYDVLQNTSFDRIEVVSRCVEIKRDVVQEDEFDNGKRGLLNFGHTFGHAIEKLSDFTVSHGAAVAKGMVIAARIAPLCGFANIEKEIVELLERYNFDLTCPYSAEQLYDVVLSDKKRRGDNLTLVLPRAIGNCELATMSISDVLVKLKQIL